MKVILKENIENLGKKGDIVNVAPGYGRNYLIPKKLALKVTPSNMKMVEMEQQSLRRSFEMEASSYQELIERLNQTSLSFERKAGEKYVIFGSVSTSDIKEALDKLGFEVDKKKIILDEPIKRLGNYTVPIKIYHEERAEIKEGEAREKGKEEVMESIPEAEKEAGLEEEKAVAPGEIEEVPPAEEKPADEEKEEAEPAEEPKELDEKEEKETLPADKKEEEGET